MADIVTQRNIGALVDVVTSVLPQAAAAGTINGASIDRVAHGLAGSAVIHQVTGAETGTPTTVSVQTNVQHAPDNSTWTNYIPPGASTVAETAAVTAINTDASVAVDLSAAQRYVRVQTVVAFTGGTSPTIEVAADIVLAGERVLPAV